VHSDKENSRLIKTAREVNGYKAHWIIKNIISKAERFKSPKVACLGLSFKADIDDLRESPALDIVRYLKKHKIAELLVVEPNTCEHDEFELCSTEQAITEADIVVLLVDHQQFKQLPPSLFNEKILIDTRGCIRQ
jgi:UDP-N-acetyl-D-mannosaminuronic acid dehydrogenase